MPFKVENVTTHFDCKIRRLFVHATKIKPKTEIVEDDWIEVFEPTDDQKIIEDVDEEIDT